MTEYYDVVIVGAGIAGCGLAYNLKRFCPEKKVLIIDKNSIGSTKGYGFRNTFKEIIEEYNLPYVKKFKGLRLGNHEEVLAQLDFDFYFINYTETCNFLLNNSNATFSQEEALSVKGSRLKTIGENYIFKHLIDCSGSSFFLRNIFKLPMPFKYYLGETKIYSTSEKVEESEYFCYKGDPAGYVEDFHVFNKKIITGDWRITTDRDFDKIYSPEHRMMNKFMSSSKELESSRVTIPVSPVLPLVYKNYAFLGDSFGNCTPAVCEGVRPILNTSKILVEAIRRDDLNFYERIWKKRYLSNYIRAMAARVNLKDRFIIIKLMKKYPELLLAFMQNRKNIRLPQCIIKKYPKKLIAINLIHLLRLKLKYFFMQFS